MHDRGAYTLVEVLIVVTILGLIGGIVVPQMLAAGTFGVQAAARSVVADIMYAQSDAMSQQLVRQVVFEPNRNRYRMTNAAGQTLGARWKSGQRYIVNFGNDSRFSGVRITDVEFGSKTPHTLRFSDLGAPRSGGHIDLQFNDQTYRVTVAAFTGRVTVGELDE